MSWLAWLSWGAFYSGVGVGFGAFGAHALKSKLSAGDLAVFETGVRYQLYHGLALLALGLIASRLDSALLRTAGVFMVLGTGVFSGSLYALVLLDRRELGMVTPFGGAFLILAWTLLLVACLRAVWMQ